MTARRSVTKLRQLDDVPAAAPADGQVAAYNSGTGVFDWADAGGGGGSPDGTLIPTADTSGVSLDTTSYDNNVTGTGKLVTLVVDDPTVVVAIAQTGDAFPRTLILSDDGIYMGDGTIDPYFDGANIRGLDISGGGGLFAPQLRDGDGTTFSEFVDENGTKSWGGGEGVHFITGLKIRSAFGVPAIAGVLGDICIRVNGDVGSTLYRCTTSGAAGDAVWDAIL